MQLFRQSEPLLPRPICTLLIALVLANVCVTALVGFRFGFTHDDLMNTHWAISRNWTDLALDCLRIWKVSPVYRPAGVMCLKSIYSLFGMDVFYWRVAYGALLVALTVITGILAARISRSMFVGLIAALLVSYHAEMRQLYFSMGFVFDVLAYILTGAFVLVYIKARRLELARAS
jgi:hypothetical protein